MARHRAIEEHQNDPALLELLRAYSWYYNRAQRWHLLRVAGTIGFSAAAPVITFWLESTAEYIAAAAGLWLLVGRTLFDRLERGAREAGARVQEVFDTTLFGLDWNSGAAGRPPAHEDVTDAAHRYHRDHRDWYPPTSAAPWPLDVLICQRSSAVWGRRSHAAYATTIWSLAVTWLLVGIGMAVVADLTLAEYLIRLFLPSQPAFLDALETGARHRMLARQKQAIEEVTDNFWTRALREPQSIRSGDCRLVQDRAFELRRLGQRVPTWFYTLRRERDEFAMREAAERRIAELKDVGITRSE